MTIIVTALIALFCVICACSVSKVHLLPDNSVGGAVGGSFYATWIGVAIFVLAVNVLFAIFAWPFWILAIILGLLFVAQIFLSQNLDMAKMIAWLATPFAVTMGLLLLHALPAGAGGLMVGKCIFWPALAIIAFFLCGALRHVRPIGAGLIIVTVVVILLALASVIAYGANSGWFHRVSEAQMDIVESDLTVDLDDVSDYYADVSWEFLDNQMPNRDKERVAATGYSNAVSFPFESTDKDEAYLEIREEILRSPVYGDMVAQALATITLSSEKKLTELNPWLAEFLEKNDAAFALSEDTKVRGNEIWLTLRDGEGDTIFVTAEYREYATRICILLDRLVNKGFISDKTSVANYALNDTSYGSSRRTYASAIQESKPALILQYIRKEDDGAEVTIGFNQIDKRIEIFKEDKSVEPTNPTDPTPTTTTDPDPTPVTPDPTPVKPDPTPTPTPTPTPDPTPTTKKDPSKSSGNTGNAEKGGVVEDGVDDSGPGPYEPASSVKEPDNKTIITQPETKQEETTTESNVTVDNGTPPATDPIPVQDSSYGNGAVENNGGTNGQDNEENVHEAIDSPF